jgi:hypothetical protein
MSILPTKAAVSNAWEAYSQLCQAAAKDPLLANDNGFIAARDRAHKRWSEAFVKWDGR